MEKKSFRLEIKELGEDGSFDGYASVFGNVDSYNDIVESGAFTKTLQEQKQFPLLWSHNPYEPVGIMEGDQDKKGLKILGKLNLEVQRGRELYALLKQKAIKGLSIGYDTIKQAWDNEVRKLQEVRLWEVSLCTFPANPEATVEAVKSVDDIIAKIKEMKIEKKVFETLKALPEIAESPKGTPIDGQSPNNDGQSETHWRNLTIDELKKLKNSYGGK